MGREPENNSRTAEIPREVCERTAAQQADADANRDLGEWPAALRMLDRIDPGFRN